MSQASSRRKVIISRLARGKLARSNAKQVSAIRRILEELGLTVATPTTARHILTLKGGDGVAF